MTKPTTTLVNSLIFPQWGLVRLTGEFARRLILQSLDAILLTLRGSFATTPLIECCINYAHGALPQYLCSKDLSLIEFAYYNFATTTLTELCLNYSHRVLPRQCSDNFVSTTLFATFIPPPRSEIFAHYGLPRATTGHYKF